MAQSALVPAGLLPGSRAARRWTAPCGAARTGGEVVRCRDRHDLAVLSLTNGAGLSSPAARGCPGGPDQRTTFDPVRHPACKAHGMNCRHTRSNDQQPRWGMFPGRGYREVPSRRQSPGDSGVPATADIHRVGNCGSSARQSGIPLPRTRLIEGVIFRTGNSLRERVCRAGESGGPLPNSFRDVPALGGW